MRSTVLSLKSWAHRQSSTRQIRFFILRGLLASMSSTISQERSWEPTSHFQIRGKILALAPLNKTLSLKVCQTNGSHCGQNLESKENVQMGINMKMILKMTHQYITDIKYLGHGQFNNGLMLFCSSLISNIIGNLWAILLFPMCCAEAKWSWTWEEMGKKFKVGKWLQKINEWISTWLNEELLCGRCSATVYNATIFCFICSFNMSNRYQWLHTEIHSNLQQQTDNSFSPV